MRPGLAAIAVLAFFCLAGESRGAGVDLEVILAADVSRSIDDAEFDLQRKGYAAALTDPRVLAAIQARSGAAIGVCFIEWSGDEDQQVVVDWTEIRDEEDAGSVAAAILAAPRSFMGRTSISAAIDFAMAHFAASKWQAGRLGVGGIAQIRLIVDDGQAIDRDSLGDRLIAGLGDGTTGIVGAVAGDIDNAPTGLPL